MSVLLSEEASLGQRLPIILQNWGTMSRFWKRAKGAHHKVCGEFLSFEALSYLQEMGISLSEDSPFIKRMSNYFHRVQIPASRFPFPGRGVSRYKLDEELLNNAKNAGADVFRGVCMRDYHKEIMVLLGLKQIPGIFTQGIYFWLLENMITPKNTSVRGKDNSYIGLKTHIRLKSLSEEYKETTVLFSFPGGYGGICPVEGGVVNFCFVIERVFINL
jgi:hypothetical protein